MLQVNFRLTEALKDAAAAFKAAEDQRALFVVVEDETLTVASPVTTAATANLGDDFAAIRAALAGFASGAFVVLRVPEKGITQISYTPETLKPKLRMLYAASSSHLRQEANMGIKGEAHVTSADEVTPAMYGHAESDRTELQTEKEKAKVEVAAQLAAEQQAAAVGPKRPPMAMHGVSAPFAEDTTAAVKAFAAGESGPLLLTINAGKTSTVELHKALPAGADVGAIAAAVPEDTPIFALVKWAGEKVVLVYVCPAGCKPKAKMVCAASKPSLRAQAEELGVKVDRNVELDTAEGLEAAVAEALKDSAELAVDDKPSAPKQSASKGPRMFM
jgi:hypothetical protein